MRCLSIILSLSLVVTISSQACPDGWHSSGVVSNKCYYVAPQKKIWFDAEAFCTNSGPNAHLISIASAYENANVNAVVVSTSSVSDCHQFWIGGNDIEQTGQFVWIDGRPWGYANWAAGQPHLNQQCVSSAARTNGKWKTESCANQNCFICEMFMGGSTSLPPTIWPLTNMTDCKDWFNYGAHTDGIYSINPDGRGAFNVFCDMTTDGGGWTVFQRRNDETFSFDDKSWNEFKAGFNNGLEYDLWLGNDHIHVLSTKDFNVELRIDIWGDQNPRHPNPNGYWWEKHNSFSIDSEANLYTLNISSSYTGNASMDPSSNMNYTNNCPFATFDRTNGAPDCFSPQLGLGGWWSCSETCTADTLNGAYLGPNYEELGFRWYHSYSYGNILPYASRMMLRTLLP